MISQVIAKIWLIAIISRVIALEKHFKINHRPPGAAPPDPCITNATCCNDLISYCNNVTSSNNLASYCNNTTYCNNLASYCSNVLWQWSHILLEERWEMHHRLPGAAPRHPHITNVTDCDNVVSFRIMWILAIISKVIAKILLIAIIWRVIALEKRFKINHRPPGAGPPHY